MQINKKRNYQIKAIKTILMKITNRIIFIVLDRMDRKTTIDCLSSIKEHLHKLHIK